MSELTSPSEWVKAYSDSLLGFAILRVGDRETAKDLVQETFLSALQNRRSFRGESSEKTWLVAILKNKIIDYYRRKGSEAFSMGTTREGLDSDDPFFDESGHWARGSSPVDWGELPDEVRASEFMEVMRKCLEKLTDRCKGAFVLKFLDELDTDEICKGLAISPSNYWVVIHRAKLQLRECIERNWIKV